MSLLRLYEEMAWGRDLGLSQELLITADIRHNKSYFNNQQTRCSGDCSANGVFILSSIIC